MGRDRGLIITQALPSLHTFRCPYATLAGALRRFAAPRGASWLEPRGGCVVAGSGGVALDASTIMLVARSMPSHNALSARKIIRGCLRDTGAAT